MYNCSAPLPGDNAHKSANKQSQSMAIRTSDESDVASSSDLSAMVVLSAGFIIPFIVCTVVGTILYWRRRIRYEKIPVTQLGDDTATGSSFS